MCCLLWQINVFISVMLCVSPYIHLVKFRILDCRFAISLSTNVIIGNEKMCETKYMIQSTIVGLSYTVCLETNACMPVIIVKLFIQYPVAVLCDNVTLGQSVQNGDLQTLICVLVARPRRCLTLSNPVP